MGVRLTNSHCIIDARDPVAAEPTDKCKTAQSSPLTVYRKTFMTNLQQFSINFYLTHDIANYLQPLLALYVTAICYFH